MGNPLPAGALDHQAVSWADYGWRTGVWAALELLEKEAVPATFYISGIVTETAPDAVRAIAQAGHEIAGHSWAQNRIPALISPEEERAEIAQCTQALTTVSGQRPRGWISPRCTPSASTSTLLAAEGYQWHGDVFDADLPYWRDTPEGRIVALPFGMEINDLPLTVRYGQPTRELVSSFAFEASTLAARRPLGYVDVTLHAHVGCRPAGLLALSEIIAEARRLDLWIATRGDLAGHFVGVEPTNSVRSVGVEPTNSVRSVGVEPTNSERSVGVEPTNSERNVAH
jgi:peptidoglycan/xylan/chitin deacetylase (PgdA/CDA1 family)